LVFNQKFKLLISAKNMLIKSYDVFKLIFLFYQYLLFGFTPKKSDFLIFTQP